MNPARPSFKLTALVMAALVLVLSIPSGLARAGLVPTEQLLTERSADEDRARVGSFLRRDDVRKHLTTLGVRADEAAARVAALSDAEVRAIAGHLDTLPAGQSAVGAIVGAIVLIFVILLITDLLGLTDVFPFVKKPKR
jgi:hypothetical protein